MRLCAECLYWPAKDQRAWAQNGRCQGCAGRLDRDRTRRLAAREAARTDHAD